MKKCFPFFALCVVSSCSQIPSSGQNSKISGHFEDFTPAQLERYANQLSFVPEYAPGQNVIVSEQIFGFADLIMLKEILDAGASKLYVVMHPRDEGESPTGNLKTLLRERINSELANGENNVPPDVSNLLDVIFEKVVPVEQESPLYSRGLDEGMTVWARDWSPLAATATTGERVIMDLNYYPVRPQDDSTSRAFLKFFGSAAPASPTSPSMRISFPVYNEGGNFMNTSHWCFMTERVLEANTLPGRRGIYFNAQDEQNSGGKISADTIYNREALISLYNRFGCKNTEIFGRLPFEGTGHIDMWAKLLSEDTVLVGDLRDETIATANTPAAEAIRGANRTAAQDIANMKAMQTYLRERQQWFRERGFKVLTIPMPSNIFYFDEAYYKEMYDSFIEEGKTPEEAKALALEEAQTTLTRSYTNSLFVDGTLVTPRYQKFVAGEKPIAYPDDALLAAYEAEVKRIIEGAGFRVKFIETDKLISQGGSVHCTTMQVPW